MKKAILAITVLFFSLGAFAQSIMPIYGNFSYSGHMYFSNAQGNYQMQLWSQPTGGTIVQSWLDSSNITRFQRNMMPFQDMFLDSFGNHTYIMPHQYGVGILHKDTFYYPVHNGVTSRTFVTSVNGTKADSTGNVVVSGGGSGTLQTVTNAGNTTTDSITVQSMPIGGDYATGGYVGGTLAQPILTFDSTGLFTIQAVNGGNYSLQVFNNGLLRYNNASNGNNVFQIGQGQLDLYNTGATVEFALHTDSMSSSAAIQMPNIIGGSETKVMSCTMTLSSGAPSGLGGMGKFDLDLATNKLYFWNGTTWALITSVP